MNFYEDGTPVGFGLLKTAAMPGFIDKAIGAGAKALSDLGRATARTVGKGGKAIQTATAGGQFAQQGENIGKSIRGITPWVRQGNNALKLGGGVVAGAGALAAGGAAMTTMGNKQQPQQNNQQRW